MSETTEQVAVSTAVDAADTAVVTVEQQLRADLDALDKRLAAVETRVETWAEGAIKRLEGFIERHFNWFA